MSEWEETQDLFLFGSKRLEFGKGKKPPKWEAHRVKTLGLGTSDGWVWTREQIKLLNRLGGNPQQTRHPDKHILFLVSTRTPLYLMEKAGKELEDRVIIEHEFPRSMRYRKDMTTLYLQILWRKIFTHNELFDPKIGWPKEVHLRKSKPIRHYKSMGCKNSKQRDLLESCMVESKGIWLMHHGKGKK